MYTMKKFIRYYAPYKAVFFLDLICAAVISLVDLAFPQILRTLTKTLFAEPADRILQALLPIGSGLLVIYILTWYNFDVILIITIKERKVNHAANEKYCF